MLGIKRALCPHGTLPENARGFAAFHSNNFREVAITRKDTDIFRVCHLVLDVDPAFLTGLCGLGFLLGNRVSLYPKLALDFITQYPEC